jgi:hypothetical protein
LIYFSAAFDDRYVYVGISFLKDSSQILGCFVIVAGTGAGGDNDLNWRD